MFDDIKVKQNLPLPEEIKNLKDWKNYTFQTKDLDKCLLEYWISKEGELFEHVVEREYIPYSKEEKKKLKGWDIWKDVIEKGSREEKIDYHGTLRFYAFDELDEDTDFWVEFNAFFVYGKVDKIELAEFKLEKDRKIHNLKWEEEYKKREKHPWNVFKHYASYLGWRWFWRKVSNLLYKLSNYITKIQMFVNRYIL
jgi:hypothetical protein